MLHHNIKVRSQTSNCPYHPQHHLENPFTHSTFRSKPLFYIISINVKLILLKIHEIRQGNMHPVLYFVELLNVQNSIMQTINNVPSLRGNNIVLTDELELSEKKKHEIFPLTL